MIVRNNHAVIGINDIEFHDPGDHDDGIEKAIKADLARQAKQDEWYLKRGILLPAEVQAHRFSESIRLWMRAVMPDTAVDPDWLSQLSMESIQRRWSPERTNECPVEDIGGGYVESDEQLRERLKAHFQPRGDDIVSQIERDIQVESAPADYAAIVSGVVGRPVLSVDELLKCNPAGACEPGGHGRCWTHSKWDEPCSASHCVRAQGHDDDHVDDQGRCWSTR